MATVCGPCRASLLQARRLALVPLRTKTIIVKHAKYLPKTPPAQHQVPPSEHQDYQCYEVVGYEQKRTNETGMQVILTKYIENYGNRGDIVTVPPDIARFYLLLSGAAVYNTPENVRFFEEERRNATDTSLRLTRFCLRTARTIRSMVFVVNMNADSPWTIERSHIRVALRRKNVHCSDEHISVSSESISGPNLEKEGKLFRFYLLIDGKVVVPCVGRVHHSSFVESKEVITVGVDLAKTSDRELHESGIDPNEQLFVSRDALNIADVYKLMTERRTGAPVEEERVTSVSLFAEDELQKDAAKLKEPKWGWGTRTPRKFL